MCVCVLFVCLFLFLFLFFFLFCFDFFFFFFFFFFVLFLWFCLFFVSLFLCKRGQTFSDLFSFLLPPPIREVNNRLTGWAFAHPVN